LLERLQAGEWEPRTTLLSPFDNLIYERDRAELMFGFRFRTEIYVPKEKRQYGYYLLPVLHGDRLIGRVDAAMDRPGRRLILKSMHAEPGAPVDRKTGRAVGGAVHGLAAFLGASTVDVTGTVPESW